jgi:hypothetical protein
MSKPTKPACVPATTLEEFREAVKYLLINEHGMPPLAADDVLTIDSDYIANAFAEPGDRVAVVAEVVSELVSDGESKSGWVRSDGNTVVVEMNRQIKEHVDKLVDTGLYGEDPSEVARTMMCRGIEGVLPSLPELTRFTKAR